MFGQVVREQLVHRASEQLAASEARQALARAIRVHDLAAALGHDQGLGGRLRKRAGVSTSPSRPRAASKSVARLSGVAMLRSSAVRCGDLRWRLAPGRAFLETPRRSVLVQEIEERTRQRRLRAEHTVPDHTPFARSSSAIAGFSAVCQTTACAPSRRQVSSLSTTW